VSAVPDNAVASAFAEHSAGFFSNGLKEHKGQPFFISLPELLQG
jgi:hypothetical protein